MYQRDDDNEATVRNRLDVYETSTSPLLSLIHISDVKGGGAMGADEPNAGSSRIKGENKHDNDRPHRRHAYACA